MKPHRIIPVLFLLPIGVITIAGVKPQQSGYLSHPPFSSTPFTESAEAMLPRAGVAESLRHSSHNRVSEQPAVSFVAFPTASVLPQLKRQVRIPILLPSQLPNLGQQMYFAVNATTRAYTVDINYTADCKGTPCYYGSISAEQGGQFSDPPPVMMTGATYKPIPLGNNTFGIFMNACGAYCTATIEWKQQAILYRVSVKNGREESLTQIASSAIAAGVR